MLMKDIPSTKVLISTVYLLLAHLVYALDFHFHDYNIHFYYSLVIKTC